MGSAPGAGAYEVGGGVIDEMSQATADYQQAIKEAKIAFFAFLKDDRAHLTRNLYAALKAVNRTRAAWQRAARRKQERLKDAAA